MRILELHFNPRAKNEITDKAFDSFCYEPENIYERRMGSLYMVGELTNLLPQSLHLLNNLSRVIKGKYYAIPLQTPEIAFEEGLKKANEFLAGELQKENVSWLGNLNCAVLSLTTRSFSGTRARRNRAKGEDETTVSSTKGKLPIESDKSWQMVNFTKTGAVKILLLRAGKITDIGKNLDFEEIEPYPLKIFTKTVAGKLSFGDKIIILTKEVFDFFSSQSLLNEFAKVEFLTEKKIREILKPKEKEVSEISGVLLLIDLTKEPAEKPKIVTFQKELEKFSMKEVFTPLIKTLEGLGLAFKRVLDKISFKLGGIFLIPKLPALFAQLRKAGGKIKLKKSRPMPFSFLTLWRRRQKFGGGGKPKIKFNADLKRNLILVLFLVFVSLAGFFIFQKEEKQKLEIDEKVLNAAQEKIIEAENFLLFKDEKKANIFFREAWQKILPLTKEKGPLQNKAESLKDSVETNLKNLSKLADVADPELVFEFDPKEFIPQKIIYFNGNLYLFSPLSEKLFKINPQTKSQNFYSFPSRAERGGRRDEVSSPSRAIARGEEESLLSSPSRAERGGKRDEVSLASGKDSEVSLAVIFDKALLFFSKPDKTILFSEDKFNEPLSLKPPYSDFNFISFSSYQGNLYSLENKKGEIVKYLSPLEKGKDAPQLWLDPKAKKATDGKSMAVDGSIWILSENNTISRYHNGQYQKDLILDFFPFPKRLYKIFTFPPLPYLYLLEPTQNRIIVLEKTGEIVKQFQSEKFESLKDFAVSEEGKTIYLLNGQKVYQLEL